MDKMFSCKQYFFPLGSRTYIMGILNVTPDSFSDGGRFLKTDDALFHVQKMIEDGADIIDVGGESTRPGYKPVCEEEEMERILPVIEALRSRFDIPVSVDTYKSRVAREAAESGASIINDIYGSLKDEQILKVVQDTDCGYIIGHNSLSGETHSPVMTELIGFFNRVIRTTESLLIDMSRLCLDPGIGFAKTLEQNIEIIRNLDKLQLFDLPIMTGTSRKSVIGGILDLPVEERIEGSVASAVVCMAKGADFVRVHDVQRTKRALMVAETLWR